MKEDTTICTDPATGEVIGRVPVVGPDQVRDAIARAREAQASWAETPVKQRVRAMRRVRDHIVSHADELARTISRDNGKTRQDAMTTEVAAAAMSLSYYARKAGRFLRERGLPTGNPLLVYKRSRLRRVPFGVIGIISPWNYPLGIPFHEVVKALLAGNAVVLKIASQTQMVGRAIEECFRGAVPEGVFTHVNIPGRLAGDAFLDGGVDKLFFTGSVAVGRALMAKAAETITPVSLELGGNDPMLVCADADIERAAEGAVWGGMSNAGQSCGGVERIYVHADAYERFVETLGEKVRALRVGPASTLDVDMGAMTTPEQLETVRIQIEDALERGARIHARSGAPEEGGGTFMPALVLTAVDHTMRIMREETFGPVVCVMKVGSMEQAVELANDSELGLGASVWSRSRRHAGRLARRIRAGSVMVNDHLMCHAMAETPWGGFKRSGIGRTHGEIGFDEMTEPQCIVQDYLPLARRSMWWHPYDRTVYSGIRGFLSVLYARGPGRRLSGLLDLLRLALRYWSRKKALPG